MKKVGFEPGPLVLAFVLGTMIESATRQSLLLFGGSPAGFITRPISGTIVAVIVIVALLPLITKALRLRRPAAPNDPDATDPERDPEHETMEAK
jgi:putative tricarboxylic transport membrane protein